MLTFPLLRKIKTISPLKVAQKYSVVWAKPHYEGKFNQKIPGREREAGGLEGSERERTDGGVRKRDLGITS